MACNFYRLLKLFPNNDPIMGFILPYGKQDKAWKVGLFAFSTMVAFDFITNKIGIWTWITAVVYGLIAIGFSKYLKNKKSSLRTYTFTAIFGILLFDLVTGPIMSSVVFKISFQLAFMGQIPFTLMHISSGLTYTWILAPILDPVLGKQLAEQIYSARMHVQSNVFNFFIK